MAQDYWSQFEEVNAPSQNNNNDYWSQFEEVQQPQTQPKNVVPNRPANQELKVEEPTQDVKSDFQLNATKNYTQEMGADGKTYLVDENGNRVVNNDLSNIDKIKNNLNAKFFNAKQRILSPTGQQHKDDIKRALFIESLFLPGSIGAKGALGWALGGGLGAGALTAGENLIDEGKINPVQTTANAIIGALSGGSLYGAGKGLQALYNIPAVKKGVQLAADEFIPGFKKARLQKRKNTPLYERMTPEQLENATTPKVEPSNYGVADIDSNANKVIGEQIFNNLDTEVNLLNDYKKFHSDLTKKYGSIDKLREQALADAPKEEWGEITEALRDYRKLLEDEKTLKDAYYVSTNIKNSVTRDTPIVQNTWGNTKDVKPVKQINNAIEPSQPVVPQVQRVVPTPVKQQSVANNAEKKLSKLNQSDLGKEVNSQATYDVLHNKDLINQGTVEATKEGAYGNLLGRTLNPKEEMSALDFETGRQLATKLLSEGKTQDALNLIEGLANKASKAGQAVQALSLWSKITPEGAIAQAEKIINNYNKNATKKLPKLTEQQAQDILKLQENIMNQTDDRARDIATAQLLKYQAELIPQSAWQKTKTLRNISLLLNPKTLVRNIVGNGAFALNEVGAKALADIIDTGFSKFSGTKTRSMPKLNAMWQGLKQGTKEGIEDVRLGIDTRGGIGSRYDLPNTRSFRGGNKERMQLSEVFGSDDKVDATLQYLKDAITKNRVGQAISQKSFKPLKKIGGDLGNYLETALDYGLRVPDRTFYQGVYNESVANQLAAKGLKEITPEIEERARQEALEAVFQNDGKISNTVLGLRRALNKIGNKDFGLGDWLIPYAQTPANLVQQGINYSPLGFIKAALNKGDQRQASLDIARALIGSGLMGGGYALAKNGIGQGAVDDYQERKNLEAEGIRPFTVNGVSFNQIQPNAVPITAGMALANPSSKGVLNDALETITDLSMLDSLKQFNKDRENYGTVNAGLRQLVGLPSQFVGTGVNQINAFIDPYQRETYDPNIAKQGLNKLMAKTPGLSYALPKATDVKGEEIKKYADSPNTLAKINDVFLNPVFINKKKNNPVMQEVIRLNSDANKTLLPIAEKKLKFTKADGTEFNKTLTSKEYVAYKNKLGKEVYDNLAELMNTEFYQNADDLQKANLINKLQKDVKDRVQQDIFNKASKKDKPKISKYERKKKQYLNKQLKNFIDDNYGEE